MLKGLAFTPTDLPDFSISAAASPAAAVGGDFNYTLTATNSGPASACGDVSVQFTLPAGASSVTASGNDGFTGSYSERPWSPSPAVRSAPAPRPRSLSPCPRARPASTPHRRGRGDRPGHSRRHHRGDGICTTSIPRPSSTTVGEPDLTVGVSAPATAFTNQPLTYTLAAANSGTATATWSSGQVVAEFTLPTSSFLVVTSTNANTFGLLESQSGNTITFTAGTGGVRSTPSPRTC